MYAALDGAGAVVVLTAAAGGRRLTPSAHVAIGSAASHMLAAAKATGGAAPSEAERPHDERPASVPTALALAGDAESALLLTDAAAGRVYCFRREAATGKLEPQGSLAVEAPCALQPLVWP